MDIPFFSDPSFDAYLTITAIAFIVRAFLVKKGIGESYIYDNE
ncbi:MAG TPA: hypothetical protein VEP90_22815 [Methylomirabilota bacterium]|nr:hypothetical protein [Methylomirabilota bacterium]